MSYEAVTVRTTGRIKKPKLVFDPSDYDVPRSKISGSSSSSFQLSPTSSHNQSDRSSLSGSQELKKTQRSPGSTAVVNEIPADICSICSKREARRGIHSRNKMIYCQDCDNKVHRLCLTIDFEELDTLMKNYRCSQCRLCVVCSKKMNSNGAVPNMVTCCKCVKSYHLKCHVPPVEEDYTTISKNWHCNECMEIKTEIVKHISADSDEKKPQHIAAKPAVNQTMKQMPTAAPPKVHQHFIKKMNNTPETVNPNKRVNKVLTKPSSSETAIKHIHQQNPVKIIYETSDIKDQKPRKLPQFAATSKVVTKPLIGGPPVVSSSQNNATDVTMKLDIKTNRSSISPPVKNIQSSSLSPTSSTAYNALDPLDIPNNIKYWDVDQVTGFFAKHFPQEAHIFKEQEIDGMSLLLLKRSDIVKKLPIKLGPALKIYNLVLKLQAQVNNPTLGWNIGQ